MLESKLIHVSKKAADGRQRLVIDYSMAADDLVMQGARASEAMVSL